MKRFVGLVIILTILLVFSSGYALTKKTYYFTGTDIANDYRTGFSTLSNKEEDNLIVFNYKLNYAAILPYAEDWTFTVNDNDYLLFGNSPSKDFTISLGVSAANKSIKKFLEDLQAENIKPPDNLGMVKSEIIEFKGYPILKIAFDLAVKSNGKVNSILYNYFIAKQHRDHGLYVLHYSKAVAKNNLGSLGEDLILKELSAFQTTFWLDK